MKTVKQFMIIGIGIFLILLSCRNFIPATPTAAHTIQPRDPITSTLPASATAAPSPTYTPTPRPSATWTSPPLPTLEPVGCQRPPDDYTRVYIRGHAFNKRTVTMLQHAGELYQGEIDITNRAITQGSYHDNGAASFGTHLGGGAVDLSVRRYGEYDTILLDEIEPLIKAMRRAGFAAWLRLPNEAYSGTGIHIHAIAIGDKELSYPAQEQLTGKFGYFRGYTGIPITKGPPGPDRHNGPVFCQWMLQMGYADMRLTPAPAAIP